MKLYAIKDDSGREWAYLFYYPKNKEFIIELPDNADQWEIPMLLSSFAKKGILCVDPYRSRIWVQQRIVPYERQNIGQILRDNNLKAYDEFELLVKADGRCAQDDYYIEKISPEALPKSLKNRMRKRIGSSVALGSGIYLLTFYNGEVRKCDIKLLIQSSPDLSALIKARPDQLDKARVSAGGSILRWDERLSVSYMDIYDKGKRVSISADDIKKLISQSVIDTAEACEILGCSRQYINELVSKEKLIPIKTNEKSTLFMKSDVLNFGEK